MKDSKRDDRGVWILIQAKAPATPCSKSHFFQGAAASDVSLNADFYFNAIDDSQLRARCYNSILKRLEAEPRLLTTNYDVMIDTAVFVAPHHGSASASNSPADTEDAMLVPAAAETLLTYVTSPDRVNAILGDLEELFQKRARRHGLQGARRWYWWQVIRTTGAFLIESLKVISTIQSFLSKLGL